MDLGGWEIGYSDGVSSYECCAILCEAHRCNVLAGTAGTVNPGKFSRPMKHKNKYSNFTDPVDPAT